ncbi:hypothetical protein NSERUTF1_4629 [Nocardia seriolae]|nr:hypothetical protein NSERUTF1_4629 [Nocardia seriolae]
MPVSGQSRGRHEAVPDGDEFRRGGGQIVGYPLGALKLLVLVTTFSFPNGPPPSPTGYHAAGPGPGDM